MTAMAGKGGGQRAYWLKTLRLWHWVSAALSLAGMLLFAATGLLLNNPAWWEGEARVHTRTLMLPADLLGLVHTAGDTDADEVALPEPVQRWLQDALSVRLAAPEVEAARGELHLALAAPGADAWLSIRLEDGSVRYERNDHGWIAYFNDLHKGRNTGAAWGWMIDFMAVACLIFSVTGLALLALHARQRPGTWPLTTLGLIAPLILLLLLLH